MSGVNGKITVQPDVGIMLPDGTRLSARLWRPAHVGPTGLPAIVEYLPYRKSDGTAARDETFHPFFAQQGYVCLRVDRRGCGDSDGMFDDEYSEQELQDGVEMLAWIARQSWCNGRIGMQGISWGGFNSLQIAARRPASLKAIITLGSTVDRYADDIHYKGGIQLGENIGWAATSMSWFSMPPDPVIVGDRWREIWVQRLENTPFLAREWMQHPDRDAYWRHGSVCEDYSAVQAAVLSMGGLHDGYRNTVSHLVSHLDAPVKGVLGPWNHKYPHLSSISPTGDYVRLALAWWDHWLKGVPNEVERWPAYRAYIMASTTPDSRLTHRPGHWVSAPTWPTQDTRVRRLSLGQGTLIDPEGSHEGSQQGHHEGTPERKPDASRTAVHVVVASDLAIGRNTGEYFPFDFGVGELPEEQSEDDAISACFDSEPLTEVWTLLGAPSLVLAISADQPQAQLIVRLCDVRPDGDVALISLGLLNLRHRRGFERAEDLVPDQVYPVVLRLDEVAYQMPAGHRLRIAVSSSYWPYCWPEGRAATLTLTEGVLSLPCRQIASDTDAALPDAPAASPSERFRRCRPVAGQKVTTEDPVTGRVVVSIAGDHGETEDQHSGLRTSSDVSESWEVLRDNPATARVRIVWNRSLSRGDWSVSSRVTTQMWGLADEFRIQQTLEAFEGVERVFSKTFKADVPRYP